MNLENNRKMEKLTLTFILVLLLYTLTGFSVQSYADTPTGDSYMLYEHHGYTWVDAEKEPEDDGGV